MKKKISVFCVMLFSLIICCGIVVSAYFYISSNSSHSISTNIAENNIIIDTIDEFYTEANISGTTDSQYNDSNHISNNRVTLILNNNLILNKDTIVNRDCHIDLNSFSIDLNGHKLNIKNSYDGVVAIFDSTKTTGKIKDSQGLNKLLIDIPNATLVMEETILENMRIESVTVSPSGILNSAMRFLYSNITNVQINDFYRTNTDLLEPFDLSICEITSHENAANELLPCVYTYTDLDLIDHYYSYPIKISYLVNGVELNNTLAIDSSAASEIVLTISLTLGSDSLTKDVHIHVLDEATKLDASNSVVMQILQRYFDTVENKYVFNSVILLPKNDTYLGTNYLYSIKIKGDSNPYTSEESNDFFKPFNGSNDYVLVTIPKEAESFSIKSNINSANKSMEITNIIGNVDGGLDDYYTYCINIVQSLFGNQIDITDDTRTTSGFTEKLLPFDVVAGGYTKLKSITYTLEDNNENTYIIADFDAGNKILKTTNPKGSATDPHLGQNVLLNVKFEFKKAKETDPDVIYDIKVPIFYSLNNESEDSGNVAEFGPYFVYFDKEFKTKSNNLTYSSFEIPLFFKQQYPTYTFVVFKKGADSKYTRYTGNLFDIKIKNSVEEGYMESIVPQKGKLESFRTDINSVTSIGINPLNIEEITTEYLFLYVPIFNVSGTLTYSMEVPVMNTNGEQDVDEAGNKKFVTHTDTNLDNILTPTFLANLSVENYKYKSGLVVPGIVRCKNPSNSVIEAFENADLYNLVYTILYPGEAFDPTKNYIETSKLSTQIKEIYFGNDTSHPSYDETLNPIIKKVLAGDNFKGIERLSGLESLDFTEVALSDRPDPSTTKPAPNVNGNWVKKFDYISQLPNLKKLVLKNTGIYDKVPGGLGMPSSATNSLIIKLSNLKKLEYLDISNKDATSTPRNQIYQFTGVDQMPALKTLDVSNNNFVINTGLSFLRKPMESLVNSIYGTKGGTNVSITAVLSAKGVEIRNGGIEIKVVEGTKRIIDALSSLEYQDKIDANENISIAYESFIGKGYDFFNLLNKYSDEVKEGDKVTTKLHYNFVSINFTLPENETETNATGFIFNIEYGGSYETQDFFGQWEEKPFDTNIIYTYFYPVTRL